MAMGESFGSEAHRLLPHRSNSETAACSPFPWTVAAIGQGEKLAQAGHIVAPELLSATLAGKSTGKLSPGELAIATLPIALFYYDNLTQQRHYLVEAVAAGGGDLITADAVIVFGYAIAQAIKEQLTPASFTTQILTYLHVSLPESVVRSAELISTLEILKRLIANGSELQGVIAAFQLDAETKPMSIEIAIALYCFLQTPDNISLALNRAVQLGIKLDIVGALIGALVGTHSSTVGIPAEWQCALQTQFATPEFSQRIDHLSAQLVSAWSGVYNSFILQEKELPIATVPWVVRS